MSDLDATEPIERTGRDVARGDDPGHDPGHDGPPFRVVLIAYNTLFNLADEAAQSRCLAGAAARLEAGGRLVIETFVPADPGDPADRRAPAPGPCR